MTTPTPSTAWEAPEPVAGPAPGVAFADHGERLIAYIIDLVVVAIVVVALVVAFGYFPFFWARTGQTPGMRPFHLWVVRDRDGSPLSKGTAILRMVGMYFISSIFYIGFVWVFVDKRRRAWHDLIAGTVVIHRP